MYKYTAEYFIISVHAVKSNININNCYHIHKCSGSE